MSLKHTIQLIIKAQDEASKQVKKVEDQVKKFSNSSKNSINQANKAFELNRNNQLHDCSVPYLLLSSRVLENKHSVARRYIESSAERSEAC